MSEFTVVFDGRPVPRDRTGIGRDGKPHNRKRQIDHRRALARALELAPGRKAFEGPVRLRVVFDYRLSRTWIKFEDITEELAAAATKKGKRADVDNLVKQVMEAAELAGIVSNDVQFVIVYAEKLG